MLRYPNNSQGFNITYNGFVDDEKALKSPLIFATIYGRNYSDPVTNYLDLRSNEVGYFYADTTDSSNFTVYDYRKKTKLDAGLAMGTTLFICVVLGGGALIFSNIT